MDKDIVRNMLYADGKNSLDLRNKLKVLKSNLLILFILFIVSFLTAAIMFFKVQTNSNSIEENTIRMDTLQSNQDIMNDDSSKAKPKRDK